MTPKTLIIPAASGGQSGVQVFTGNGKYFKLTAINGTIRVITSNHDEFSFSESGSGFGNDNSAAFGKLTFYNDGGTAVTITFYVSLSPITLPDANVTSSVTVNAQMTNTLAGCAAAVPADAAVNTVLANHAYAFAGASTPFRKMTIQAFQAFAAPGSAPTANAGIVYIGVSNNHQPIAMNPGDIWTFEAPTGAKYDLIDFYISAPNAGDGVLIIYS